ncbi:endonuclease/exonuclease/phosphatase family protein [Dokdonia sinensis]|uniref:Endonuclease/exonuclease/phosphatase family protein n=1 Tax=Dokdonia sinensis TaxID=2479847 RepID=A0A3M0G8K2_9FLAO|nr:endonuclease/exonuclease/phosphatase family protein [Dokdonia sinensis]RMB60487.1 endonuclease/exonuclease/phosphatase family protein [Dokdonia sinensis]
MRIFLKVILIFILFTQLLSCVGQTTEEVSFMTFNIWQEGTSVPDGFNQIRDVIIATTPDVVCFTEVRNYNDEDWTTKMVTALAEKGHDYNRGYAGGDVSFISKYPIDSGTQIFGNSDKGTIVQFDVHIAGNIIKVAGAHLDYTYYACYLPRGYNGGSPDWKMRDDGKGKPLPMINTDSIQAYNLESTRDEAIASFIDATKDSSQPVILMGDFNEPSFLDWTEKTKHLFDHNGVVMPWYTTKQLDGNGFIDAYRAFYPDEVANPGFTWPSVTSANKSTSWTPLADERDRIDYIFYRGNGITVKDIALVGPKASYVFNNSETLDTDKDTFMASNLPWLSDHKAVFGRFLFAFEE